MESSGRGRAVRRHSIFLKILVTMSVMAVLILLVVGTFYFSFYGSQIGAPLQRLIRSHVELLAGEIGDPPDPAKAAKLAGAGGFEVRFESPDLNWSTSEGLPSIARARESAGASKALPRSLWSRTEIVPGPRGGAFLFQWNFGWAAGVHNEIFAAVLLLIVIFVLGAHLAIRYHLKPIKSLRRGVESLGAGDFSVQIPVRGDDELASLSEAFNVMIRRIGEMIKARDQLLIDVSHELRSPLTRMKLALEFIPAGEKKGRLQADVAEMEAMIAELLEIERLKNEHGRIHLEPEDLAGLLREAAGGFAGRRPELRIRNAGEPLFVPMDSERMRIVLKNIIENALKYSSPDGPPVDIDVEKTEESIVVRFRDEGPGIPEDEIARVFDPFYRVDRSRSKTTGGYGLGLAMCRNIMEAHRGTIDIRNNPKNGLTVVLTLPKKSPNVG